MTGRSLDRSLARIHFWMTFVGVNVTFFPMHFLGLAGMPRRIPDYPNAYEGWNSVASFGSTISAIGGVLFIYILVESLVNNRVVEADKGR